MTSSSLPFKVLNYNDLLNELHSGQNVSLSQCVDFPSDVLDFQDSTISPHSHESILTYLNLNNYQGNRLDILCDGYVDLIFLFEGLSYLEVGHRSSEYDRNDIMMILNAQRFSIVKPAGSKKRGIHFKIRPEVLIAEYGLCVDLMPVHVKDAMLGHSKQPLTLKATLSARSKVALIDIYKCKMQGVLFGKYLHAKTDELVCETVQALNLAYKFRQIDRVLGPDERHRQLIEAAAHIYRQKIGQAPSNAEMARMLGLNRNNFHHGFKELFGM